MIDFKKYQSLPLAIRGNWEVLSSDVKYEDELGLKVIEDRVVRPDGKFGIYGRVTATPGVCVIPVDEEGNVYLFNKFINTWNKTALGCITGGVNPWETNEQCALREMKNRTGLVAKRVDSILNYEPSGILYSPQEAFLARDLRLETSRPKDTEEMELVKMPFESAMDEIGKRIAGACSIAALYRARDIIAEDEIRYGIKTKKENQNIPIVRSNNRKVLSSDVKYENKFGLKVTKNKVIRPDGKLETYSGITAKPGVCVIPVDEEGNVYLINAFMYTWNKTVQGCLTGSVEPRETNEQCALRETEEETGLVAKKVDSILNYQPSEILYSPQEAFLARDLRLETSRPEGTEEIRLVKMPLESAMDEIGKRIVGASSISALYRARDIMATV